MAHTAINVSAAAGMMPVLCECKTALQTISLDGDRRYQLVHLGVAYDTTTPATGAVFCAFAARGGTPPTITAAFPENLTALAATTLLFSGKPVTIGPGVGVMSFISSAGGETFLLIPV